jgi:PST family polysaccharide transporter
MMRLPRSDHDVPRETSGDAYEPRENLTGTVVTNLKWSVSSRLIRDGTRFALGIVLARLLTPAEWGVAGMALVVVALVAMLTDVGLAAALIQRVRITEADRSTLFWASLGIGLAATVICIALSGLVARFFGEPQVQALFAVASLTFAISSLERLPGTLLTREMAFRALEIRQITATVAGASVAFALALAGAGAWAIVGNAVATAVVSCALLWFLTSWRPRFLFDWPSFRRMTSYGGKLLASQLATYFQINADKILAGRYLGAASLGNYQLAYQLMFMPVGSIAYPLQGVLFPALSSIQDDHDRLSRAWIRGKRLSVAIMAPLFVTMLVIAPDFIPTVFGSAWIDAVSILQLLCVAGVAHSLATLNWSVLMVRDKTGTLFRLTLFVSAIVVGFATVGLHWGIVGVAAAVAIAYWLVTVPEMWITTRATGVDFRAAMQATCSSLPAVAVAGGAAALARAGLVDVGVPALLRIVVAMCLILVVYGAALYATSAPLRVEMAAAAHKLLRARSARATPDASAADA